MAECMQQASSGGLGQLLEHRVDVLAAATSARRRIFGLGIMPYISASIIFQLLGSVYPPLEKLQKEGESGRKKINEYTRYATVVHLPRPELVLRRLRRSSSGLVDETVPGCRRSY